jgi:AraC-like DNA-binding protein
MAMTFHSIERLGAPFSSVSELGFVIPDGGEVAVHNVERKILFYLQADATMEIEQVGTFRVRTGDIVVIPCRCEQHIRVTERGQSAKAHVLKIAFAIPPLVGPATRHGTSPVRGNPEVDFGAFVRHHLRQIRHLPNAQTAAMREILRAIRREAEEHPPGIRHRVRALATNLVVHVARMVHEAPAPSQTSTPTPAPLVNQVKEYLLRNYARELTLGEIAWHVHKSEEHVARVFRKVTGQTVFEYLRTVRLESAKTLLINSDKTLTEIARLSGFGSLALFSRNFTHYVGRSASAYRQERARGVKWQPP